MIGVAALAVGIWQVVENDDYSDLTGQSNTTAAAISIVSGIIAILVALLGIIGAIALSRILIGLVSYETETKGVEYMGSNVYWFISLSVMCSMP
jgi:hypothetical protein